MRSLLFAIANAAGNSAQDYTTHLVGAVRIEFTARDTWCGSGTITFVGVAISSGRASG